MRTLSASIAVGGIGLVALWIATDGGRALTTESARRLAVEHRPVELPAVALEDQSGHRLTLADLHGRSVLVDFIYTSCPSACPLLGRSFQRIRRLMPAALLLSVSFDRERDTPERLREYAGHYGADGVGWRIARPVGAADAHAVLRAFGVSAIPDGAGGFVHNAAIHVLDRSGHLVRILDLDDIEGSVQSVRAP